ncbi:MAG TPA: hypothetical protein VK150_00835 [Geothrix sp.]|nr:hypothetical protein [Geothrix sp.]
MAEVHARAAEELRAEALRREQVERELLALRMEVEAMRSSEAERSEARRDRSTPRPSDTEATSTMATIAEFVRVVQGASEVVRGASEVARDASEVAKGATEARVASGEPGTSREVRGYSGALWSKLAARAELTKLGRQKRPSFMTFLDWRRRVERWARMAGGGEMTMDSLTPRDIADAAWHILDPALLEELRARRRLE